MYLDKIDKNHLIIIQNYVIMTLGCQYFADSPKTVVFREYMPKNFKVGAV